MASQGVRIQVLRDLAVRAKVAGAATTADVCQKVIKPATQEQQCALVDTLTGLFVRALVCLFVCLFVRFVCFFRSHTSPTGGSRALVAPATVFVSHAWRYEYSLVVAVLEAYAEEHPDTFFWFDLVMNNQHKAMDYPFEWWCSTFKENIAAIGTVVLVMAPWSDPVPLTPAWCLWEIFSAATAEGVELKVRLPPAEQASFGTALDKDMKAAMNVLVRVQAERSEAFLAAPARPHQAWTAQGMPCLILP